MTEKLKSVTVELDYPVTFDGREYSSLTFRRMKAKDALVAESEENNARAGYMLFAALAGVELGVIEELDVSDLSKIGEAIEPFLGKRGQEAKKQALQALAGDK